MAMTPTPTQKAPHRKFASWRLSAFALLTVVLIGCSAPDPTIQADAIKKELAIHFLSESIEAQNIATQYVLKDGSIFLYIDEPPSIAVKNNDDSFSPVTDIRTLKGGMTIFFTKSFSGYGQRPDITELKFNKPQKNKQGVLECQFTAKVDVQEWNYTSDTNPFAAITATVLPLGFDSMPFSEQERFLNDCLSQYAFTAPLVLPCLTQTARGEALDIYQKLNPFSKPNWTVRSFQQNIMNKKLIWMPDTQTWTLQHNSTNFTNISPIPLPTMNAITPPEGNMLFMDRIFWGATTSETLNMKKNGYIVKYGIWLSPEQLNCISTLTHTFNKALHTENPFKAYQEMSAQFDIFNNAMKQWPHVSNALKTHPDAESFRKMDVLSLLAELKKECQQLQAREKERQAREKEREKARREADYKNQLAATLKNLLQMEIETLQQTMQQEWETYCNEAKTQLQQNAAALITDFYTPLRLSDNEIRMTLAEVLISKVVKRKSFLFQTSTPPKLTIFNNLKNKILQQLEENFKLTPIGSVIAVNTINGTVKGGLNSISDDNIRVNRRVIWKQHILKDDYWKFWKEDRDSHIRNILDTNDELQTQLWKQTVTHLLNSGFLPKYAIIADKRPLESVDFTDLNVWEKQSDWLKGLLNDKLVQHILTFKEKHGFMPELDDWKPSQKHLEELTQKAIELINHK